MKRIRKFLYHIFKILHKKIVFINWNSWVKKQSKIKIIIGASRRIKNIMWASSTNYEGWFPMEQYFFDLTKHSDFVKMFSQKKISFILAEHVLEHLTNEDIFIMLKHFWEFSADDINIRIAVPDGFHGNNDYIEQVKPHGKGLGADDHKNLFTYKSLSKIFENAGFKTHLVEYWDENRIFHKGYTNDDKGYITRSFINDSRNSAGNPVYTSLIIDFTKNSSA